MIRLVVLALAACGNRNAEPPPPPPSSPASPAIVADASRETSCADAIARLEKIREAEPGELSDLAETCERLPWSAAYRSCIAHVENIDGVRTCDRAAFLALGVDLGGPACTAVIDHVARLERLDDTTYASMRDSLVLSCGAYSRALKECTLAATDHAGLVACGIEHADSRR